MKTNKNSLNVSITRPNQVLIVMRGIPGSGKSTKAKELAGSNGVIHSTDDVIESQGNYNEFFKQMIASKDFTPLSRAHSTNLKNLFKSLKDGLSPVILDNTNIKQNEAKAAVKAALELGLSDKNINFVDIGTGGLSAQELSKRNTHGVPLDKIEAMIASHTSQGPLSVQSVMSAKDMYPQSNVLYSAVVLEKASQNVLFSNVGKMIPEGWIKYGHHMTINMGPLKDKSILGTKQYLVVNKVGISDMAMAVAVQSDIETKNEISHVTVAINPDGGKPVMSNEITNWQDIRMFILLGEVTEIKKRS
jgi:predicted kinase